MSDMRLARAKLETAITLIGEGKLEKAIDAINEGITLTVREPPVRKAPRRSVRMTAELASKIRSHAMAHPEATYMQMAVKFGVTVGRISEALNGLR